MSRKVLLLGSSSLRSGKKSLAPTQSRVFFAVSSTPQTVPRAFDPDDPIWRLRESDGDYRKTNELFDRLQDARIAGKTLLEFVSYERVSLWQFLPSYIWPAFFRVVELVDVISRIIEEINPQEIRLFPVNDDIAPFWQGIVGAVGEAHEIPVNVIECPRLGLRQSLRGKVREVLRRIGVGLFIHETHRLRKKVCDMLHSMERRWSGRWCGQAMTHSGVGKKLLFASLARHWVPIPGDSHRKYDEQIFPLLAALRATGWTSFVGIDCPYSTDQSKLAERMRDDEPGVRWRAFYSYGKRSSAALTSARAIFAQLWQVLQNDPEFDEYFRYEGVRLMPALLQEFRRAFLHILPECVQMLTIASKILTEERPDAVVATYETGPFQRALVIQAKRLGIATVGLQHGSIFANHYDYMHRRIVPDLTLDAVGFFVPEITCVWGPFWKRNLTEIGHYPPESVVVTGSWRHDRIMEISESINVADMKKKLRLSSDKKGVLILSGSQHVLDYVRQCVQAVAAQPKCTPLIKLHPSDDPDSVHEILQQLGYPDEILVEGQLIEALKVADLVVSQLSTAISDAVLFGKPVILVNLYGLSGAEAYVESGTCLYVTKPEGLSAAIKKGFETSVRAKMESERTKFISECFYRIDGRAAFRVVEALEARLAMHRSLDVPKQT